MADILIVDDNAAFRKMLKGAVLSKFPSMQIHEAKDALSAMEKTEEDVPDLIFVDIRLPGENGLQLTKRIKTSYPHIVVIVITSYDSPEYRDAALESGADFFVSKVESTTKDLVEKVELIFSPR